MCSSGTLRGIACAYALVGAFSIGCLDAKGEELQRSNDHSPSDAEETVAPPLWSGETGVNFVNAYYAYGILQENQGAIAEPYVNVTRVLRESDAFIGKVTIALQLWSSIHSENTEVSPDSDIPPWYEFDVSLPVSVTIAKRITLSVGYVEYRFPNGALETERSVSSTIALDDSDWLGRFALHPHLTVLYNFEGIVGTSKSDAWYGEAGIAPSMIVGKENRFHATITFPVLLGFGDEHFYPQNRFGYLSAGLNTSVSIGFVSKKLSDWNLNVGFTYMRLGKATADVNANEDHNAYVGQVGIAFPF